jgi:hypothetical protein
MAYDSLEALRAAGFFSGEPNPAVEEVLRGLTKEETEFLISFESKIKAAMPEVQAHSHGWSTPEAAQQGLDAAMLCACGLWSGSGIN